MTTTTDTEAAPETAHLTADVAVFGMRDNQMHVLLILRVWPPYEAHSALPGGYVDAGELPLAAAYRELAEEAGLTVEGLEPVGVYADPGRDPRGRHVTWLYAVLLPDTPRPTAGSDAAEARWMPVDRFLSDPPLMAFDHYDLVRDALDLYV